MAASPVFRESTKRILIIRLRRIGDTVLITPCLSALKSWRPDIEIDVLLETTSTPVLQHHPLVNQVIEMPVGSGKLASALSRLQIIGSLRSRKYDLIINLHGGPTSMLIAWLSGARATVALAKHPGSWLMTMRAPDPSDIWHKTELHAVENQLALLRWLDVPIPSPPPRTSLTVAPDALTAITQRLRESGINDRYAVVHPSAAYPAKQWDLQRFAEVIAFLHNSCGMPSVLISTPSEKANIEKLLSLTTTPAIGLHDIALSQTMALIARSSIFLGNDSGPAHIAAALNVPLVVIYGVMAFSSGWYPWTDAPYHAVEPGKRDIRLCPQAPCSPCAYPDCIRQVSASQVIRAVSDIVVHAPTTIPI